MSSFVKYPPYTVYRFQAWVMLQATDWWLLLLAGAIFTVANRGTVYLINGNHPGAGNTAIVGE
jgi:hypothetical protein